MEQSGNGNVQTVNVSVNMPRVAPMFKRKSARTDVSHFFIISEHVKHGMVTAKCKICSKEFASSGTQRMMQHLNGEQGVEACEDSIRKVFGGGDKTTERREALQRLSDARDAIAVSVNDRDAKKMRSELKDNITSLELADGVLEALPVGSKKSVQTSIKKLNSVAKSDVDAAWAQCFYTNGMPFNIASSESFRDAVTKTANFGMGYYAPCYKQLAGNLLDDSVERARSRIQKVHHDRAMCRYTIASDGWTSIAGNRLLVCLFACLFICMYVCMCVCLLFT